MSLALKFGTDVLGAMESLRIQRAGNAPNAIETWQVLLAVDAATPLALESAVQALRDKQGTTADMKLVSGLTDVRTLAVPDCRHGPVLTDVRETDDSPGEAHNQRRLTLVFQATLQDAGIAVQAHTSTVRLVSRPGLAASILQTGKGVLRASENPVDHETTVLPAVASGYRRVRALITRDVNEPSLAYEVEDEQVFTALPGGVEDGHYVITESQEPNGTAVRTITGFFTGLSAKARALELRPAGDNLVTARVSWNPFTRRVDFVYQEQLTDDEGTAQAESVTFTTTRRVIDHALLDASLPAYRQQVGAPQTEVIQEGSAVGNGRHVSPPPVRFAADLIERRVHYSVPHPALPPDRRWTTTWRYVCRTRAPIYESTP